MSDKKPEASKFVHDTDLVNLQTMRETRRKIKLLASLERFKNIPEYLEWLIGRAYEVALLNNRSNIKKTK